MQGAEGDIWKTAFETWFAQTGDLPESIYIADEAVAYHRFEKDREVKNADADEHTDADGHL
jgi:hypothetical protein